jgi:predicted flap endonuclease-1-like 5' DNA nuclease
MGRHIMKSQSPLVNLIPIFIIVIGVMALAVSIPNALLHLGDSFLSLFSVTQAFWMGVLWVVTGGLLLFWRRSSTHLRRMVALLILAIGIIGVAVAALLGVFSGTATVSTFNLTDILWLGAAYIVVGIILLLLFRADEPDVQTAAEAEGAKSAWKSLTAVPENAPLLSEEKAEPPSIERIQQSVARKTDPGKPDDLTLLEGIGPKIQEALYAGGITTFAQIAQMTPEALEEMVKVKGKVRMVGDAATWPRQAQYLVLGDAVGFENYIKYLIAGREPEQPDG